MIKQFIIIVVLLLNSQLYSQHPTSLFDQEEKKLIHAEMDRYSFRLDPQSLKSVASEWFDVSYYGLNLAITTYPQYLSGVVTIKGVCREPVSPMLVFDLMNSMHVDSVKVDGVLYPFVQEQASLNINLDFIFPSGQWFTVDIYYRGLPLSTGFGSFMFGTHADVPWVWSLSEPYGARDWFPCKDHPSDKADSADIIVTCDSAFKVGSNGKLDSVINNGDGTQTHYWQERYPIASYLISVAITNYEQFSNWYKYSPTDSMEVLNYVLPENIASALNNLPRTVDMLEIFSNLFGQYPFIKEKYGHADFGRGGAMEHQTMTSTTTYDENTIAHELAHQWFGDMITCRTWSDLWLNEGFAQYSTALYLEKRYGNSAYWKYMKQQLDNARFAVGRIYVRDTSVVRDLFDVSRVYSKGASVLHMLRHVLGDSVFFRSLFNYANQPTLKYKTVSTYDFQSVCESTSGTNLTYFFDEWIYSESYPHYSLQWGEKYSMGNYTITLEINQAIHTSDPSIFIMPLDIKFVGEGWDTTITVFNNVQRQILSFAVTHSIKAVQLDPEEWVLKNVFEDLQSSLILQQNYPNPFDQTTRIDYHIPKKIKVKLEVFNLLGQKVETLVDDIKTMGDYRVFWNAGDLPSGAYFYRLQTSERQVIKKMILVREH